MIEIWEGEIVWVGIGGTIDLSYRQAVEVDGVRSLVSTRTEALADISASGLKSHPTEHVPQQAMYYLTLRTMCESSKTA
jgi:hypothetical protein